MRPEAEPWWRQAQADLDSAEVLLQGGRFYAASWYARQAAELGLKALYIERRAIGAVPPRTHDLQFLGRDVGAPAAVQLDLSALGPVFGVARYPDVAGRPPIDVIGRMDTTAHVDAARSVLAWIGLQL